MSEAEASIEKLFAEPYVPAWMKKQRESELIAQQEQAIKKNKWRQLLVERVNMAWKLEAERSHHRIMAKCDGVWYKSE